jgi:hypothetical protein
MIKPSVAIFSLALAFSACASFPPPTDTVASSLASVRGAEELGAADVPQAALQLQLARDELKLANKLIAEGENERAKSVALRAGNDAELAIALVREHDARKESKLAKERVEAAKNPGVSQ